MPPERPQVLLIAPGTPRRRGGAAVRLPLALLSLAAWLRRAHPGDIDIKLWDMRVDPDPPCQALEQATIVGVTSMTGQQIRHGLRAMDALRRCNPRAVTVWGGIHPSLLPRQTAEDGRVDVAVVGEGEETFQEIVEAVVVARPVAGIPGTVSRGADGVVREGPPRALLSMDRLPLPAYDMVAMKDYPGVLDQFDYQSSRGCPFGCTFCYNTIFCGRRWRPKSAEKVVAELGEIRSRYPVRGIALVDDEFFIDAGRATRIVDGVRRKGLGITASCRLDIARRLAGDQLIALRAGGFRHMYFGAESGSPRMLALMHKGIDTDDIMVGAQRVARAGIRPCLSFMSGFPDETEEDFARTLDIIQRLRDTDPLVTVNGVFPYSPYPGTDMFGRAVAAGLRAPARLESWGTWSFQYRPTGAWLTPARRRAMRTVFLLVRFRYYLDMLHDRHAGTWRWPLLRLLAAPLALSERIRWKRRWFAAAWEWDALAAVVQRMIGYL